MSDDEVVIRRVVEADLPALVRLLADDVISATRETPDDLAPYSTAFAVIDADPNQLLVVMDRAGELVGTLHLTLMPSLMRRGRPRANVEAVRVASSERGRGLGAQLMAWADDQARAWGCALVQLTSDQARPDAHRFYARLGYVPSHVGFKKPLAGRALTAHERAAGEEWDASYTGASPAPWDIGRAQPAVERLVAEGRFRGAVLDAGCGSGENALAVAATGRSVLGFDVAGTALAMAREKATARGLAVEFVEADALRLPDLGRVFDSVLDVGLFHALDVRERERYVAGLATVTRLGGTLFVLCFSDHEPATGPHPVSRDELTGAFADGWVVESVERSLIRTNFHDERGGPAWLATFTRR